MNYWSYNIFFYPTHLTALQFFCMISNIYDNYIILYACLQEKIVQRTKSCVAILLKVI